MLDDDRPEDGKDDRPADGDDSREGNRPRKGDDERTEVLLHRARQGSREAQLMVFHKMWHYLLQRTRASRTWSTLKLHMEPEDAVQGLSLQLFRLNSLESFEDRGEGSLRAWLKCCLEHHLVGLVRTINTKRRGGGVSTVSIQDGDSTTPGAILPSSDPGAPSLAGFAEWAQRCRETLQHREYEVWSLRIDGSLKYDEIGKRLGLSHDAARSLYRRAKKRLSDSGLLADLE